MSKTPKTSKIIAGYRASCTRAIHANPSMANAIKEKYDEKIKLVQKCAQECGKDADCGNVVCRVVADPSKFDYILIAVDKRTKHPFIVPMQFMKEG